MAMKKTQENKKQKPFLKNLNNEEKVMAGVIAILLISVIILAYPYLKNLKLNSGEKIYSVDITKIQDEGCKECFNLNLISDILSQAGNVKIGKEKTLNYSSPEAKKLIDKHGIKKIPAMIVSSRDISKLE